MTDKTTRATLENLHTFHPFPSDATPQQICDEINKGLYQVDKITRALFIGERLLSEHKRYKHAVHMEDTADYDCPGFFFEEFTAWLESPDGLKAVRDAITSKTRITVNQWMGSGCISYHCCMMPYGTDRLVSYNSQESSESESILTATEDFLRDE